MKKNAGNLKLWKISIPYDRDDEIQKFSLQENDELLAIMDIGDYWKVEEITKKHIHVFVSGRCSHTDCVISSSTKIIPHIYLNCIVPIFQIKISCEELVNSLKFMVGKKLQLPSNHFALDKLTHENIKVYQIIEELKNLQIRFAQREWTSWKRFFVTLIGMKICIIVI
uniref:Uncharacterized protein n=1 Tax=Rhizophagus irregularis (strain DAOM 181602 / DAOM 197198 / MUCL 43194) TaxID=747089 RepID=U9TIZ8_RHIID